MNFVLNLVPHFSPFWRLHPCTYWLRLSTILAFSFFCLPPWPAGLPASYPCTITRMESNHTKAGLFTAAWLYHPLCHPCSWRRLSSCRFSSWLRVGSSCSGLRRQRQRPAAAAAARRHPTCCHHQRSPHQQHVMMHCASCVWLGSAWAWGVRPRRQSPGFPRCSVTGCWIIPGEIHPAPTPQVRCSTAPGNNVFLHGSSNLLCSKLFKGTSVDIDCFLARWRCDCTKRTSAYTTSQNPNV